MYFVIPVPFSLSVFCVFVFFFCSHWSLVDVPLIFFCPADHVPDWQPRVLLGMVEARSVNVKKTTTVQSSAGHKTKYSNVRGGALISDELEPSSSTLVFYFLIYFSERAAWVCCQTFFFCSIFPVQQTTSGIGHRVKYS